MLSVWREADSCFKPTIKFTSIYPNKEEEKINVFFHAWDSITNPDRRPVFSSHHLIQQLEQSVCSDLRAGAFRTI
jgi:hypothetical protein